MRATQHAPRGPFCLLERRHGLAEIVVDLLQRVGHACRAPGGQCATAEPDAIDFLLRSTFDALAARNPSFEVASPDSSGGRSGGPRSSTGALAN